MEGIRTGATKPLKCFLSTELYKEKVNSDAAVYDSYLSLRHLILCQ